GVVVVVVHLEHEPCVPRHFESGAGRYDPRPRAGRPSPEIAGGAESRAPEAGVARAGIATVQFDRVPRRIDVRDRVMHDLPVARHELHTSDVARLGEDVVYDKTAVDIARLTGNRVDLRREGEVR